MFFFRKLKQTIVVPPSFYNESLKKTILSFLYESTEGKCIQNIGLIVSITKIISISQNGVALNGLASFTVYYTAVIINLEKGICIDATVVEVSKMGIFANIGPISLFVSKMQVPSNKVITRGADIRVRIMGSKTENGKIFAIGSIKDECLGVLDWECL